MIDLRFDPELEEFRREVRAFFAEVMSPDRLAGHLDPTDLTGVDEQFEREVLRECGRRGWLGISVPRELGGAGRPLSWQAVFGHEAAYADAPAVDTAITLAGAPLLAHGSPEQLARLVPPMLAGEVIGAIAYSEVGAGSDLTMIETRAEPDPGGDGWIVDGTKAHVTAGHKADWCIVTALTETGEDRRRAMSMFVVPLDLPGITIRRRPTINGWTLSEIEMRRVRLDAGALLGERGNGWRQMASALLAERSGYLHLGFAARRFDDLVEWARTSGAATDPDVAATIGTLRARLDTATRFAKRVLWRQDRGEPTPPHEAAMAKIAATELLQHLARETVRILGPDGMRWAPLLQPDPAIPLGGRAAWERLDRIRETISVGTNELQRSTIAQSAFGIPRG